MAKFDVLSITLHGERLVQDCPTLDAAFDACLTQWSDRKSGGPVYAVRDSETEQRWSYRDIQELRAAGVSQ
jgi:hypothetical protein